MDMQPIEPARLMNAQLVAEQWNIVFAGLNRMEHGTARPVFDSLMQQLRPQNVTQQAPRAVPDGP